MDTNDTTEPTALERRAAAVAGELYAERIEPGHPLRGHETLLRMLMSEAYARGFVAGLEHASDCVRTEAEATRGELADTSLVEAIEAALRARGLRHAVQRIEDNDGEVVIWAGGAGHPVSSVEQAVELAQKYA